MIALSIVFLGEPKSSVAMRRESEIRVANEKRVQLSKSQGRVKDDEFKRWQLIYQTIYVAFNIRFYYK